MDSIIKVRRSKEEADQLSKGCFGSPGAECTGVHRPASNTAGSPGKAVKDLLKNYAKVRGFFLMF